MRNIVLVTGGFDPLHSGHLDLFKAAADLGDVLVVGVNSDEWLTRKKGRPFQFWDERVEIIDNLRMVSSVIDFDDTDDTAVDAINRVHTIYPQDRITFANGGDRTATNIAEMEAEYEADVEFVFGVGGTEKKNSSSWILNDFIEETSRVGRIWGDYSVLKEYGPECKIKELIVAPGRCLSNQRHFKREEVWFVLEGKGKVIMQHGGDTDGDMITVRTLEKGDVTLIEKVQWHQLINAGPEDLKIIEIQHGTACIEEDIERQ
tara:strand:- start:2923 stop:3705 length:783 start_codon:yes stop_codon:yes gene_type:complete